MTKDVEEKIKAQDDLCAKRKYPHFVPYDGICYRCYRQIYEAISLDDAKETLISGCPYCHVSYCD